MIDAFKYYITSMYAKGYVSAGLALTVFKELFARYIFSDWEFVKFLFVLVVLDTAFAIFRVIRSEGVRGLSLKQADNVLVKLFLYFGTLILVHVAQNFTVHGKPTTVFTWIDTFIYTYIIAKEMLSVARHINAIKPDWVPAWVIERLNRFQETGKPADLIKDRDELPKPPSTTQPTE